MKAILIARVSTEEQKEADNSLPAQIYRLEQYCQSSLIRAEFILSLSKGLAAPQ
jgi:DNA invertase Pin-like site-specific DNA recombinase